MESRGRGRARGRARGAPQQQQQGQGGPRPGPPQQQPGAWGAARFGPPSQAPPGAWGGRAPPPSQQPPAAAQSTWGVRPPPPETLPQQSVGRGSRLGGGDERHVSSESSHGGRVAQGGDTGVEEKRGGGNGNVRGRTDRNEVINTRPTTCKTKKGTDGTTIKLKANYFPLINTASWGLNQYRVDFVPETDDTREKRALVRRAFANILITGYIFDGTNLYTPSKLHPDPLELVSANDKEEQYRISARLVGEVKLGDYHYFQLFNLVVRRCLEAMDFKLIGRDYYDPKLKITVHEHNLELWPGFETSMRQYDAGIMLTVDLKFKMLRMDNVYDLLLECSQKSKNPKVEFQQRVIGSIVMTYYNNKTYRIDDVAFDQTPNSTFKKRDGSEISYRKYFEERYKVKITVPNQPMLVSRSKPREIRAGMPEVVILVPQLCTMTGLTDKQRENFHLMKALGEHTRVNPSGRMKKLREFSQRLLQCPKAVEELKRWDLQLAQDIVEFNGRVLPQESVYIGKSQAIPSGPKADWTQGLRSAPLFNSTPLERLAVVCPSRLKQPTADFVQSIQQVSRGMNFQVGQFKIFDLGDDRAQSYLDTLEHIISNLGPKMVFVVLANNSSDKYSAVKKKCYVDRAMPCQVALGKNVQKNNKSVATKIAIQMNCKLGGAPWGMTMPKNIMVVGYDVCRDTAMRSKSFSGMVATMDQACSSYFSMSVEHEFEQEMSSNIATFIMLACKEYQTKNGVIPERIIIYRDGVGDGQIQYVKEHEVEMIKEKLGAELYANQPLKMAFIVVSKRINTKLFTAQPGGDRGDFNPPPGTVVDDVVTLPYRYDFFLISQCVNQGTVAPTSYNIIDDNLGIDPNRIQRFTYKLTHMYYNWSGTIRVPAPCQYAHKLAFMTAQYLHRSASAGLNKTLFFI
ncbi:piwi-like protein Siwi [Sitophilus oryzae]|uniref:Piwi-like protein Siwi n=1 Tax=Sitophilus oryzae TaxID=7048 RepID=A0A6J2XJ31_SITOR|nr:piwi-like protein Siwi [Sitophilus oryzae]